MGYVNSRTRVIAVAVVLTFVALAWPATARADCQFVIQARNTHKDRSLYLQLYESKVLRRSTFLAGWVQLKISNVRVGPGKTEQANYKAPGPCSGKRSWTIKYRRAKASALLEKHFWTDKDALYAPDGKRVLDLGDVGKWF